MPPTSHPRLDAQGYPVSPSSIFIAVRREHLPTREALEKIKREYSHPTIELPVRRYGVWETLVGFVESVHFFNDGIVVRYPQNLTISPLKWTQAALWIPNCGTAGILS